MSNFWNNLFDNKNSISIYKVFFSLISIIAIRILLENYSNQAFSGYLFGWEDTFLHFPAYYISTFLSFAILLYVQTNRPISDINQFLTKIFILMWIPPIIDLFVTNGEGDKMMLILRDIQEIPMIFVKLLSPFSTMGITFGTHIASFLLLLTMSIYVYKYKLSILKSLSTIIIGYTILFMYAIIPTIIAFIQSLTFKTDTVQQLYSSQLAESWIKITQEKTIVVFSQIAQETILQNILMARIFFVVLVIQLGILLFISHKRYWSVIKKSLRIERVFNYFLLAIIGMLIAKNLQSQLGMGNVVNQITLVTFIFTLAVSSILAVFINDAEDIKIDEISNSQRPLAKKDCTLKEWHEIRFILIILTVFGIATLNRAAGFFLLLVQAVYYLYSSHPLRLKKHFISSSFVMGFATVAATMSGFFLVSADQRLVAFPIKAIFIIGLVQALLSNMKDIKDYKGDKIEDIKTLPVVFGLKKSKIIIGLLYVTVFLTLPFFLSIDSMYLFSFILSIFVFYLFTKKHYQEKYIFLTMFAYMGVLYFLI